MSDAWKDDEPSGGFGFMFGRPLTEEERAEAKVKWDTRLAEGNLRALMLPRFSREHSCAKCGQTAARVRYCPGSCPAALDQCGASEHMHRECKRCGFEWYEKPLTTDDPLAEAAR